MISIENTEIFGKTIADALVCVDTNPNLQTWEKLRITNAIAKASHRLQDPRYAPFIDFDGDADRLLVWNPETNKIYEVTGHATCQCEAFNQGNYCWHRAAKRLYQIYFHANIKFEFERKAILDGNRDAFVRAGMFPAGTFPEVAR